MKKTLIFIGIFLIGISLITIPFILQVVFPKEVLREVVKLKPVYVEKIVYKDFEMKDIKVQKVSDTCYLIRSTPGQDWQVSVLQEGDNKSLKIERYNY